ncbi:type I restriction endonuclease [Aristaeella hokkaidonensis]|uniref:Type I restriction endonuclease subunit R n=1 Tax=Aristaeella hokkaidonensis TaxID=3046382 RepID=A0AC61MUU5_9FIRM|nr:type I restriction endonuclease [Aristaeella hokkaidonensis]QUC66117.1 type I restriction endonuclease subunit R [Aristaeella hokkaidonensis]SNT94880.1 type I restriction enzyme, R subunit [Aristaeella hokkaidonensis]
MPHSQYNEATRVQMPAMVHLTRLGYRYFGKIYEDMAGVVYDPDTNILINEFCNKFDELNPEHSGEGLSVLRQIRQELDNDDIGESFYKRLHSVSPVKLIDFEHLEKNSFCFTGEFTCRRDEDEFRPDITLFINGLPLVFIEVKKPNNIGGMVAEAERMNRQRFPNKKFRRFINITQLMIFSNNMEYDAMGGIVPLQGVFYCTASKKYAPFNCFREENPLNHPVAPYHNDYPYLPIDPIVEKKILEEFNCQVIHTASEYQTNLNINTPTNRALTSMCSPKRLLFILKYAFAYYHKTREKEDGTIERIDQKHIMRYQQMFAALKVREKISQGVTSGVIWHTQGSGKTALSYHLNYVLTDYYASTKKVAKFYFIVDRLDLLKQAREEFEARGLIVKTANSRDELMNQFRENQSLEGNTGANEITVVNIQRFKEDNEKITLPPYATNLQRILIIDEAHRGYRPEGSFLMNLVNADRNAVKLALTGTPLLKEERESWRVFGTYIHTYYYDKSVQDGYTLKIIREDIETSYREKLEQIYHSLETLVQKKEIKKAQIIEHDNYIDELLRYVITDLNKFRTIRGDNSLGGMIICETSEQARKLFAHFDGIQMELNQDASNPSHLKAGLILYDSDDKEIRGQIIDDFKINNTIDILIVFNMLLTGFDAPRLKRLYFGRKLKDHNLLQAITRVNRPYGKDMRYGYIIDFADIKQNFEETNAAYLAELNKYNDPNEVGHGNEISIVTQVLEDRNALKNRIQEARQILFDYSLDNAEVFNTEISTIEDKQKLLDLRKALVEVRDCFNMIRTFGDKELIDSFSGYQIENIKDYISNVQLRIKSVNQREAIERGDEIAGMLNEAMQDIEFNFSKIGEEELRIVAGGEELQNKFQAVTRKFAENVDPEDPVFITLKEAYLERFKEHGFQPANIDEYNDYSRFFDEVLRKLEDIQTKNNALMRRYNHDAKFVRVHKRIREENARRQVERTKPIVSLYDESIVQALMKIKNSVDQKVYDRNDILKKDAYFEQTVMTEIKSQMDQMGMASSREDRTFIQGRITKQYLNQYNETYLVS